MEYDYKQLIEWKPGDYVMSVYPSHSRAVEANPLCYLKYAGVAHYNCLTRYESEEDVYGYACVVEDTASVCQICYKHVRAEPLRWFEREHHWAARFRATTAIPPAWCELARWRGELGIMRTSRYAGEAFVSFAAIDRWSDVLISHLATQRTVHIGPWRQLIFLRPVNLPAHVAEHIAAP